MLTPFGIRTLLSAIQGVAIYFLASLIVDGFWATMFTGWLIIFIFFMEDIIDATKE